MKQLVLAIALAMVLSSLTAAPARAATAHNDTISGIEIFAGFAVGEVRYGATFVGRATGELPGYIVASINYTPPNPGAGVTNTVVGGRWTLTVVQGGEFRGKLTGTIAGGAAVWNGTGTLASINLALAVASGTGAYSGATGTGSFTGVLSHFTFPPQWGGALTLSF
ncbi:MAG TPA: hypothetical protein VI056_12320 [Candidatus Limnocylindria bacterium]